MLGVLAYQAGKNEHAVELISRALELQPDLMEAHNNLGLVLQRLGRAQSAKSSYQKAIDLNERYADAHCNMGNILRELGELDDAVTSYQKTLSLNPEYILAHNNLGLIFQKLGKLEEALSCFEKAASLRPELADTYEHALHQSELGNVEEAVDSYCGVLAIQQAMDVGTQHHQAGRLAQAETIYQQILETKPDQPTATHMLGVVAHQSGKNELAVRLISRSLKKLPNLPEAHNNKGLALRELGRLEDAGASFRTALDLKHDFAEAHYNLGMLQLLTGNFLDGWENYAWRWKMPQHFHSKTYDKRPVWDGSPIGGKTILIYPEQGLGDTIQFVRYVQLLSELGARVILETPEQLLGLFKHIGNTVKLVGPGERAPSFDYHVSLLDIPRLVNTSLDNIPSYSSYLKSQPDIVKKIENCLHFPDQFRLGIVWAGSPTHQYDKNRSIDATLFKPLVAIPGICVYSLQVGRRGEAVKTFGEEIIDTAPFLNDFSDTAAVITKLDLMVTVDTAVAHIAAALGCQTRTLLPFVPDWRWLLKRNDTPWYPSMSLARQTKSNDWKTVISRVRQEIIELLE